MNILRNFFTDTHGTVVIAQWPNWPLWGVIFFVLLQQIPNAELQALSTWAITLLLLYWSYLEIRYGVNYWRRTLGAFIFISQFLKIVAFF